MPQGKITKLVHLSTDAELTGARIDASHNDTGYGYIEGPGGETVYFSYADLPPHHFDHLQEGQPVEYEVEADLGGQVQRAKSVLPG